MPAKPLSHAARTERRRKMAELYSHLLNDRELPVGECLSRVAAKFDISIPQIRRACLENGIDVPRVLGRSLQSSTLKIVAELIEGEQPAEIARKHSLTRQRVSTIQQQAEKAGVFKAVAKRVKAGE